MKIGMLMASMSRDAGGLFFAVTKLAGALQDDRCGLRIFAGKDRFSEKDKAEWGATNVTVLPQLGPKSFGFQAGLVSLLRTSQLNAIHVHGLWMYPSLAVTRLNRTRIPYVISPHGMLDAWALANSGWKKRIAATLYENKHLSGAACIHALCYDEYASIRAYGLRNPVAIIPNGVMLPTGNGVPTPAWRKRIGENSRILLFLGRIHPKKGLIQLLQAWRLLSRFRDNIQPAWHVVIAGWDQAGHESELRKIVEQNGLSDSVHFIGPQFGADKEATLGAVDAFILPSFSEGLPMAVLEAWSYSLPVLMTPQCNIVEGFRHRAAIRIEPTPESIARELSDFWQMDWLIQREVGRRGHDLVRDKFSWPSISKDYIAVYRWMVAGGTPPACLVFA